ncbi:MAG TPA: patatin-like phospholipase family protein [Clostridiaceae bacterium]|nr:patatin-like phospholipase family protein [Clostridiaceae bacterium]
MKIGIALSGGGIRGIAHAGVLDALEKNNIKIDIIGGTSCGAIIASLYAMGYSPYHIYILFKRYAKKIAKMNSAPILSGIKNIIWNKKISITGLRNGKNIEEIYNEYATRKGIKSISQIKMPIVIPTVDITESKEYIFTNNIPQNATNKNQYITDISVGKAIRASSSFPAFFSPCRVEKHAFMDGGAMDNIPVREVKKQGADKVIAVKFDADQIDEESNIMDIVMKTIDIMGSKISEESLEMSDYILNVYTDKVGLLDVEKLDKCYKYGYDCVMNRIDDIKKKLEI